MTEAISRRAEVQIDVEPTPEELAEVFWHMDDQEQARFFTKLGDISGIKLTMQMACVADSDALSFNGKQAMHMIGEYGND